MADLLLSGGIAQKHDAGFDVAAVIRPNQGAARTARRPHGSFRHDLVVSS